MGDDAKAVENPYALCPECTARAEGRKIGSCMCGADCIDIVEAWKEGYQEAQALVDAAVQKAEEKFQRMIPVLLTWKENMATEAECAQARDDLVAAGITPEYIASLSISNTTPGGSDE